MSNKHQTWHEPGITRTSQTAEPPAWHRRACGGACCTPEPSPELLWTGSALVQQLKPAEPEDCGTWRPEGERQTLPIPAHVQKSALGPWKRTRRRDYKRMQTQKYKSSEDKMEMNAHVPGCGKGPTVCSGGRTEAACSQASCQQTWTPTGCVWTGEREILHKRSRENVQVLIIRIMNLKMWLPDFGWTLFYSQVKQKWKKGYLTTEIVSCAFAL